MKSLLLAALTLAVSATGFAKPAKSYEFKVDLRLLDGPLHQISIVPDESGVYSAKHVITSSGFGAPAATSEVELGNSLACVESFADNVLNNLTCSVDNRPVDGRLNEIIAIRDESGNYTISQHTSYYNRLEGGEVENTEEILSNAVLLRDPPKAYLFEVDGRPVDGNLVQVSLKKAKDGSYTATEIVTTAGYGSPVKTKRTKLGSGLICVETVYLTTLESVICSIDMRPADGYLTEVLAYLNQDGTYTVSLHKAAYSMIGGTDLDETTVIDERFSLAK